MKKKGFTLVELLAVIAILSILVIIALPNIVGMFTKAKKDLFLTEVKTLYKESANKFISNSMSGSNSQNIYCKSASDDISPIDVTTRDVYYYIEKDSSGVTKKIVVWNGQGFVSKQVGEKVNLNDITIDSLEEMDTSDVTCDNVLTKLNVIPKLSKSYTVVASSGLVSSHIGINAFINDSSSNPDFNKVKYVIYRKIKRSYSKETETEFKKIYEVVQTNKLEDFSLEYDDNDTDFSDDVEYRVEVYTDSGIKIGEISTTYMYCFVAGTKVKTESGFKNIEDIKVGEKVYSYNLENNELELKTVTHLIKSYTIDTYKMTIGGKTVEMSPKHQIYIVDKGWVRAYDVKVGDLMLSSNNEKIEITNIEYKKYDEPINTYNLTVDGNSNYFVTDIQVLVHNVPSLSILEREK